MLDTVFQGIFESGTGATISVPDFLLCIGVSLVIGVFFCRFLHI
mgnify:CR=1 FL=1